MHKVLRHSGRISLRISEGRVASFSSSTIRRISTPAPDDQDKASSRESQTAAARDQDVEEEGTGAGRRHSLRRTLRQRRLNDIPPPPPLPAWFLEHNVRSISDTDDVNDSSLTQSVDCIDEESGARLFTVPCSDETADILLGKTKLDNINLETSADHDVLQTLAIIQAAFAFAGQPTSTLSADVLLTHPEHRKREALHTSVETIAWELGAQVVAVDANDIADLTGDYVGQGSEAQGTFATLAHDIYEDHSVALLSDNESGLRRETEVEEKEEDEEDDEEDDESHGSGFHAFGPDLKHIREVISSHIGSIGKGLEGLPIAIKIPMKMPMGMMPEPVEAPRSRRKSDYIQWDDTRLQAVLEQIVDAPQQTRSTPAAAQILKPGLASQWTKIISEGLAHQETGVRFEPSKAQVKSPFPARRTIIHLQDVGYIWQSKLGETIVRRLTEVVRKRRRLGEQVAIIATAAGKTLTGDLHQDQPYIEVSRGSDTLFPRLPSYQHLDKKTLANEEQRILEINMRNINSLLRRMAYGSDESELLSLPTLQLTFRQARIFKEHVLPYDAVRTLALMAVGLADQLKSHTVQPLHISLAAAIKELPLLSGTRVPEGTSTFHDLFPAPGKIKGMLNISGEDMGKLRSSMMGKDVAAELGKRRRERSALTEPRKSLSEIKRNCNSHETRLLSGVVDADNIKTGFNDVHVAKETVEALKTATTLSLTRPDAFKYGVLAKDNLSGLMLYGPPGTGKTLLAKAVAKESQARVLEISGAQVNEKYVGEGEKMVRAVFTLAKKLSPCVVFIDEADALLGARNSNSNRAAHRELINQFLREWDGMDDHKIFIMVATNRPFDIDDAVLRRLPRRLLVDLPAATDRENILGIHLRDEQLNAEISLSRLAEQTPLYSGSDLKNVCVSAALSAVREENELAAKHAEDADFSLPEKRTLEQHHFDKAIQEISASINEDMSSLNAIKKFDEQYGDRRGRKKKSSYGFGAAAAAVDENAARVRQPDP